jgi:AI-2 transport protein TqsA
MLAICTLILVFAAAHLAGSILAPITCALFLVSMTWPLQKRLEQLLPKLLALAAVVFVTIVSVATVGSMVVWGVTRVGRWFIANAARLQGLYAQKAEWLAQHDIYIGSLAMEHFDVGWMIRLLQEVMLQLQGFLSFAFVAFIFFMLGLLEVGMSRQKFAGFANGEAGQIVIRAATETAGKLRRYMLVRTLMSVLTGFVIWGFAILTGLDLAVEWGMVAFALNFIPFIGPLVATVLPTLLAIAQFESMYAAIVIFLCLNLIQFAIGSYLEPRVAGVTLSLSPFMVLFAVFFGSFLWGISGAFLGVPVLIATVTVCAQIPSARWIAQMLAGQPEAAH